MSIRGPNAPAFPREVLPRVSSRPSFLIRLHRTRQKITNPPSIRHRGWVGFASFDLFPARVLPTHRRRLSGKTGTGAEFSHLIISYLYHSAGARKSIPRNKFLRHHVVNGTFIGGIHSGMDLSRTKLVITTSGQKVGAFSKSKVIEMVRMDRNPSIGPAGG